MQYPIAQIADITGGQFIAPPHEAAIEHILLDSRQVIFPASSLFIALQGRRFNGLEFIADLYADGVRNFLVSKKPTTLQDFPNANFILVKNTQDAFHALAAWHRQQFTLPVVGITGSNGKTIVKEWLFQLLHEDYHIVRSPKSFNSQTGVPLSVLQITPEHTLAIFEAGISKPGEMERLARIIAPDIGIFTNIGEAHQEGFPDIETKIREKLQLFKDCKTLVYCVDNELVAAAIRNPHFVIPEGNLIRSQRLVTWSAMGKDADIQVAIKFQDSSSTQLEVSWSSTVNRQPSTVNRQPSTANRQNPVHGCRQHRECHALLGLAPAPRHSR
jgi:UDP-N-acetylmuramyl pentapeptide synthase